MSDYHCAWSCFSSSDEETSPDLWQDSRIKRYQEPTGKWVYNHYHVCCQLATIPGALLSSWKRKRQKFENCLFFNPICLWLNSKLLKGFPATLILPLRWCWFLAGCRWQLKLWISWLALLVKFQAWSRKQFCECVGTMVSAWMLCGVGCEHQLLK